MQVQINLLGFICEAFGQNEKIYKDIDDLYQKRKYEFYRYAKNDELYDQQIITEGSLLQEEYCKKTLGILIYQDENPDDEEIINDANKIIEKGWPYIWSYMNHSEISLSKFMYSYSKKCGGYDNMTDDEINSSLVILIILALGSDKKLIQDEIYNDTLQVMFERMENYNSENRVDLSKIPNDSKKLIGQLKDILFEKIGKVTDYNSLLVNTGVNDDLEMASFMFDLENITSSIFYNVKFTKTDINEIIFIYSLFNKDIDKIDSNHLTQYFIYNLHIRYLLKAYKQSKDHYFKNNKEIMFVELEQIEKDLDVTKKSLDYQITNNEKIVSENESLYSKITRLEAELAEEKEKNNELNGLREFFFGLDSKVEFKETATDYTNLKKSKILILGGHEKWQSRMKEHLPEAVFIHADMMNFDLSVVDNVEAIFIYANYLNHAIYYRLMSYAKGSKKISYINKQNEDLVLKEIQDKLNDL